MGMYYSAEIVVGLPYKEVDEDIEEKVLEQELHPVEDLSPYYDGYGQGLFGITIRCSGDYSWTEIEELSELQEDIDSAKKTFKEATGLEGKVYLTTRGS